MVATMSEIEKQELMHVKHGETWVSKLCRRSLKRKADVQSVLDFWFPKVNKIFGKESHKSNKRLSALQIEAKR